MSHGRERKQKDCLNCGTIVQGRYCQNCGQENIEPKESFWSMVMHFFNDITHFDGKFFLTLKDLLLKPGFLPGEYIRGKRMSYLHPVRMYIFTSAIFFLIFFSVSSIEDRVRVTDDEPFTREMRDSALKTVREKLEKTPGNFNLAKQLSLLSDTSLVLSNSDILAYSDDFMAVGTLGGTYTSRKAYDSIQQTLPKSERDGWLKSLWNKRATTINDKYKYEKAFSVRDFLDEVLHKLPYLLFVSLPFFALLLKLLYIRRKQYYYADHAIFSIHHYIFSFILLLFIFCLNWLNNVTDWSVWGYFLAAAFIWGGIYLYISLKKFYKQGYWKTFFKFVLLNFLGFLIVVILFVFFTIFAVFQL